MTTPPRGDEIRDRREEAVAQPEDATPRVADGAEREALLDRLSSGDYAGNASESLEQLRAGWGEDEGRDAALERWLRTKAAATAEALDADPGSAIPARDIRGHFTPRSTDR